VHLLLPPSEGKTPPADGPALDLESLSLPELTATRSRVLAALLRLARGPEGRARAVLGLSPRQLDELARDAGLDAEPCASAGQVYTGVLYDALDLASLPTAARRRAERMVLVSSGLFGMLRLTDPIPAYRLSGDTDLPGVGPLAAAWRGPLEEALTTPLARGLVVDLRSGAYAAHWTPRGAVAERAVTVRVLQEVRSGRTVTRKVVSHHNKATKGRLVRALALSGVTPRDLPGLIDACSDLGFRAEPGKPGSGGVRSIDLVVDEV